MIIIFFDFVLMGHGIQIFPTLVLYVLKIALLLLITGEVNKTQNKQQQQKENQNTFLNIIINLYERYETSLTFVYVK